MDAPIYEEAVNYLSKIEKNYFSIYKKGTALYARNLLDEVSKIYRRKLHVASLYELRKYVAET